MLTCMYQDLSHVPPKAVLSRQTATAPPSKPNPVLLCPYHSGWDFTLTSNPPPNQPNHKTPPSQPPPSSAPTPPPPSAAPPDPALISHWLSASRAAAPRSPGSNSNRRARCAVLVVEGGGGCCPHLGRRRRRRRGGCSGR